MKCSINCLYTSGDDAVALVVNTIEIRWTTSVVTYNLSKCCYGNLHRHDASVAVGWRTCVLG